MSQKSIFCVAASHHQAERIADQLKLVSFPDHAITLLYPDADTAQNSAHVLLAVSTANAEEVARAKAIFTAAGAGDICTSSEAVPADAPEKTAPLPASPSSVHYTLSR